MYIRKGPETFTQQIYYYYLRTLERSVDVSLLIKAFLLQQSCSNLFLSLKMYVKLS